MDVDNRIAVAAVAATSFAASCSADVADGAHDTTGVMPDGSTSAADTTSPAQIEPPGSTGDVPPSPGDDGPFAPDPSWTRWSIRAPSYVVPAQETTYACFGVSIPVDRLHHVVAFEPVVVDASLVHHMVLATTPEPFEDLEPCYPAPWGATMQWGWAPGADAFELPEEAGFLVGDTGPAVHFVIQIHYGNPLLEAGHEDESGVDVHVVDDLRPHHAAVFSTGDVAGLAIPAGQESWPTIHVCRDPVGDAEPVHVFGSWLHAHTLGRALWSELRRDGEIVAELGRHDPYRIDAQRFEPLDVFIEPSDDIWTHCVFDSTSRTEPTLGGGGIEDEMCLNYLMYWPRVEWLGHCTED